MIPPRALARLVALTLVLSVSWIPSSGLEAAQLNARELNAARIDQRMFHAKVKQHVRRQHRQQQLEGKRAVTPKRWWERLHFSSDTLEGYDRNVQFDSSHKGSLYTEQDLSVGLLDRLGRRFSYYLSYDTHYTNYYDAADHNTFGQTLGIESALKLHPRLFLESGYSYWNYRRPQQAQADFQQHQVSLGLKHYLIPKLLYHKPSYVFERRDYRKAKARILVDGDDAPTGTPRRDTAHALDYEIGVRLMPSLMLQVSNQLGWHDSNDQFFDFYDYGSYRVTPIVTWQPTKRFLTIAGVQFQRNNYKTRALSGMAERQDLTALFGNAYYQLNEYASVGFHCTYTKNDSTLPELEFQDATFSAGLHLQY